MRKQSLANSTKRRLFFFQTPLGEIKITLEGKTVLRLSFGDHLNESPWEAQPNKKSHLLVENLKKQMDEFFDQKRSFFDIPYKLIGTPFQKKVWQALSGIPFGQTISYSKLAELIGEPKATRAVANTVAKNPLVILLPCHRVIGQDGSLRGFSAGIERKKALLALEGFALAKKSLTRSKGLNNARISFHKGSAN